MLHYKIPATSSPVALFSQPPSQSGDAALIACDYQMFPLERVEPLADGGKEHIYSINGHEVIRTVRPTGPNFATATDPQRGRYGAPNPADKMEQCNPGI